MVRFEIEQPEPKPLALKGKLEVAEDGGLYVAVNGLILLVLTVEGFVRFSRMDKDMQAMLPGLKFTTGGKIAATE